MNSTIFLTGSTGLVGRHLLSLFLKNSDARLYLLARRSAIPALISCQLNLNVMTPIAMLFPIAVSALAAASSF